MFNIQELDIGTNGEDFTNFIYQEIIQDRVYEKFHTVEPGDVVVDIGANIGVFAYSLKYSNPAHVVCIEPSFSIAETLRCNLQKLPFKTTVLNCGIGKATEIKKIDAGYEYIYGAKQDIFLTRSFREIVNELGLTKIDFLKTDCEGAEYDIFTEENYDYLTNNVRYITGEWHLSAVRNGLQKFTEFRDRYLKGRPNVKVFEPWLWKEVTEYVMTEEYLPAFMDWWAPRGDAQLMVYIDNTATVLK